MCPPINMDNGFAVAVPAPVDYVSLSVSILSEMLDRRFSQFRIDFRIFLDDLETRSEMRWQNSLAEMETRWQNALAGMETRWQKALAEMEKRFQNSLTETEGRLCNAISELDENSDSQRSIAHQ